MKRSIVAIVVIALVAIAVFGSQALAVPPQNLPTTQNILNFLLGMNDTITGIQGNVTQIKGELDDPTYGLEEIKDEVAAIEAEVDGMDAKFDGMAKMESYSGVVLIWPGNSTIAVEETYFEARHVCLTVSVSEFSGLESGDTVRVLDWSVGFIGAYQILLIDSSGPNYATVEFVTTEWSFEAYNSDAIDNVNPLQLDYKYTVTYPG